MGLWDVSRRASQAEGFLFFFFFFIRVKNREADVEHDFGTSTENSERKTLGIRNPRKSRDMCQTLGYTNFLLLDEITL